MKNKFPKRKPTRLKDYDYSTPGMYFITICTHNRREIFSKIVGAIHESPENNLTQYGCYVDDVINTLADKFEITIDKYVIMPNHIHLLIFISDGERAIRESPLQQHHRSIIDKMVGYLKMNTSKKIHTICQEEKIWQRSYHDHIIRGENDYQKIWEYIDTNVLRWEKDCFYTSETEQ